MQANNQQQQQPIMKSTAAKKFDAYKPMPMRQLTENVNHIRFHSSARSADYGTKMFITLGEPDSEKVKKLPPMITPEVKTSSISLYEGNYTALFAPVKKEDDLMTAQLQTALSHRIAELVHQNQKVLFPTAKKGVEFTLEQIQEAVKPFMLPTDQPDKYTNAIKIKYSYGGAMESGQWVRDTTKFGTLNARTPIAVDASGRNLELTPANASSLINPGSRGVAALTLPFVFCAIKEKKPHVYTSFQCVYMKMTHLAEAGGSTFDIDVSGMLGDAMTEDNTLVSDMM